MFQLLPQDTYSKQDYFSDNMSDYVFTEYYNALISNNRDINTSRPLQTQRFSADWNGTYPSKAPGILELEDIYVHLGDEFYKTLEKRVDDTQVNRVVLFKRNLKINIANANPKKKLGFRLTGPDIEKKKKELEQLKIKYGIE